MILLKYDQTENNTPVKFTPEAIESMFEQMKKNSYPVYRDQNNNICIKGSCHKKDFDINPVNFSLCARLLNKGN